jgi:hypothetical protein
MRELCRQYSVDVGTEFEDDDEEELISPMKSAQPIADLESLEFEVLIAKLIGEHEAVLRRGQGIFGIIDDDSFGMHERVLSLIQSHGIPIVERSDDGIISAVENLIAGISPSTPS